jgi:anti-anti-sigma regulatory factor
MAEAGSPVTGTDPIALPMDCTIESVLELHASLRAVIAQPTPLLVDAGAVDRCDTAGIQLLLAAARAAAAHGQRFELRHSTPALRTVATALGLDEALGLRTPDSAHA